MKKIGLITIWITLLLLLTACGNKFPDTQALETTTGKDVSSSGSVTAATEANTIVENTAAEESGKDYSIYMGVWYTPEGLWGTNSSTDDIITNGGIIINITQVSDGKIQFLFEFETAAEVSGCTASSESMLDKNGTTKFLVQDSEGNKASMAMELRGDSLALNVELNEQVSETWHLPKPDKTYELVREMSADSSRKSSPNSIESPTRGNFREYLAQFGITGNLAEDVIRLNNYIINNNITSEERIKELRNSYDLADNVQLLNELIPEEVKEPNEPNSLDNSAQHYDDLLARRAQLKEEYAKKAKAFFEEHYGVLASKDYYMYSNMMDPKQIAKFKKEEDVEDIVFPYEETLALVPWGPDRTRGVRILDQLDNGHLVICLKCVACGDEVSVNGTVGYKQDYSVTRTCGKCGAEQNVFIRWESELPLPDLSR